MILKFIFKVSQVKKYIIGSLVFLFLITEQLCAIGQVTVREAVRLPDLMKEGRKANKRIWLLFCTEWCAPCKDLEKIYFKDSALADYLETNYIIGKYDAEKQLGIPIAAKYGVRQYPTIVVIDTNGQFYYRVIGITVDAASQLSTLKYHDSAFSKPVVGISNKIQLNFPDFYIKFYTDRYKKIPEAAIVDKYLSVQPNLKSEVVWRVLYQFEYDSRYDQFILDNYKELTTLYDTEARIKVNAIIEKYIKKAIVERNKEDYWAVLRFMEANNFPEQRVLEARIKFYLLFQDLNQDFGALLKAYFDRYDHSLLLLCDNLYFQKNIEFIDQIMLVKLAGKISNDSNPNWKLYMGLFREKQSGLKAALPYYSSFFSQVAGDVKKIEQFVRLREKLSDQ